MVSNRKPYYTGVHIVNLRKILKASVSMTDNSTGTFADLKFPILTTGPQGFRKKKIVIAVRIISYLGKTLLPFCM